MGPPGLEPRTKGLWELTSKENHQDFKRLRRLFIGVQCVVDLMQLEELLTHSLV